MHELGQTRPHIARVEQVPEGSIHGIVTRQTQQISAQSRPETPLGDQDWSLDGYSNFIFEIRGYSAQALTGTAQNSMHSTQRSVSSLSKNIKENRLRGGAM